MTNQLIEVPARRTNATERALALESRPDCPTCGARDGEVVWYGRFRDPPAHEWIAQYRYAGDPIAELGDASFELVRCNHCTMLFHTRVLSPAGLTRLYSHWIDAAQIERFESERASRFEIARQTFKHLLRLHSLAGEPADFRVLDFGCGDGRALSLAIGLGFDAWGVDSSVTRESRSSRHGARVRRSISEVVEAAGGGFHAVMLMQVLEHVVSPRRVLEELEAVLRRSGVLLVEVPDARCIDRAPTSFEQFRIVQPLEHVNAFTPRTLTRICVEAGFTPAARIPAHATATFKDVVRTELSRVIQRASTSQYFVRTG